MTRRRNGMVRAGNAVGVWLYRRTNGRIGGRSRGTTIGLLTVPGRRTGVARTVPVAFFPYGTGYVVAASAGGAPADPHWFRNLRSARRATVQIGPEHLTVEARVAEGAERDRLWREVVLVQAPARARYERRAGRVIPVAVLTPGGTTPATESP